MPINKSDDKISKSEQDMQNLSFDLDFNILTTEMIGYDTDAGVLRRVGVKSTGALEVDI